MVEDATEVSRPEGQLPSSEVPPLIKGGTWEQFSSGSSFRTAGRTITETDLVQFVTWAGFTESLFLDATQPSIAGHGRLVPAALVYCIAEGLIIQTNAFNGTGLAFLGMELAAQSPVAVGDTIHAVVTTTESRPSSRPGRGVVTTRVSVRNQDDREVLVFTPTRLVRAADREQPEL